MSALYGLAVVIATSRREHLLRRTLESVAASRLPSTFKELLVVENGGESGARAVVDSFADRLPVRYLFLDEGNKTRALNTALRNTTADLIYFLDDDVRVDPAAIGAYADAASRYGRGHHFSGPLIPEWEAEPPDWLKPYLPTSATGWYYGEEEKYDDRPAFIGSNWAAFREDILSAGAFAEHIGPGTPAGAIGDETELQERMLAGGGRGVYLPAARIWHRVPQSDCDFRWARERQHRMGVTYGVLGRRAYFGPIARGLPGWWTFARMMGRLSVARALGLSEERRVHIEMASAHARGYLKGRRLARRGNESA